MWSIPGIQKISLIFNYWSPFCPVEDNESLIDYLDWVTFPNDETVIVWDFNYPDTAKMAPRQI